MEGAINFKEFEIFNNKADKVQYKCKVHVLTFKQPFSPKLSRVKSHTT